jgi:hypothetical protein
MHPSDKAAICSHFVSKYDESGWDRRRDFYSEQLFDERRVILRIPAFVLGRNRAGGRVPPVRSTS